MARVKRDNTPERMRAWLDSIPLVTEPPTPETLFEARTIVGVELLHALENEDPPLVENLRKAYALLAGLQLPEQLPTEHALVHATDRRCWNCGGAGVRCCEYAADR